jgi:hypothetical protein
MYAPIARCRVAVSHNPITIGSRSRKLSERMRASAMRLTRVAPRTTATGGIIALTIPRTE